MFGQSLFGHEPFATISPDLTIALTGRALSVAQGSLSASSSIALTGQSLSVALGSVTVLGSVITASLTGQGMSLGLGIMVASVINGPQLQDIFIPSANLLSEGI